jgi:hypothetical protein
LILLVVAIGALIIIIVIRRLIFQWVTQIK